jgi:hypothetical protein
MNSGGTAARYFTPMTFQAELLMAVESTIEKQKYILTTNNN